MLVQLTMTRDSVPPCGESPVVPGGPWGLLLELGGEGRGSLEVRAPWGECWGEEEAAPAPLLAGGGRWGGGEPPDTPLASGGRAGAEGWGAALGGGLLQGRGRGGGEAERSFLPGGGSFSVPPEASPSSSSSSSKGFLPS